MAANLPTCNICKSIIEQTKQRRKLNPPCPGVNEEARQFYGDFVNPAFKALASHEDYYVCRKDFLLLERAQKAQITVQTIIRDMKLSIGVRIPVLVKVSWTAAMTIQFKEVVLAL